MADNIQQNHQNQQPQYYQTSPQPVPPQQKPKKPIYKKWWFWLIIVIVLLIVICMFSGGDSQDSGETANNTTVSSQSNDSVDADKNTENSNQIGDYICKVKSAKICKNWEGKDAVKITYEFTNNAEEPTSFDIALMDSIYQDGIELESTFIDSDDDFGLDVKIKSGVTKEVNKVYLLRDKTTDLEVEIEELISFSDDKIVTTVKLK